MLGTAKTYMKSKLVAFLLSLCLAALVPSLSANEGGTHYYRQLVYNHDSPVAPYVGTYEITKDAAQNADHYEFVYDSNGKLAKILNYSSESWRNHQLTHLGAYCTAFSYIGTKEIRQFYDKDGKRVMNLRKVYKEVYTSGADGFKQSLEFFDLGDKPMESDWNISRYTWAKQGGMIIERRYNLKGELVPLSPYFKFEISGIVLNANGDFIEHYNLNDKLEVTDNENGIASYKNTYANNGNLLNITYYNKRGDVVPSPWKFAIVNLGYNDKGNPISENLMDENGNFVVRGVFTYDERGKLITNKE